MITAVFNSKIRANFFHFKSILQSVYSQRKQTNKKVLLFHAASSGEFEQLKPILKNINRKKYFIIQSFTSNTIYNQENATCLVDATCYQPFDFIWLSKYYFKLIKPDKYIITRHDIWPTHILTASNMGIECILINANIHNNSIWMRNSFFSLSKKIFSKFNYILVPSLDIKKKLDLLFLDTNIIITGDSRYSQIINRYHNNKNEDILPLSFKKSTNLIFGSIDIQDEKIIFQALNSLYPNGDKDLENKKIKLIIVPHEVDKDTINRLSQSVIGNNFSFSLFSEITSVKNINVLIVNKVGFLADLYKYSNVAYIGGGFSRGVHSVIEPAIYNNHIAFGPNIEMLDEAKELLDTNLVSQIFSSKDMITFLNSNYKKNTEINLKNFIFNKKNIAEQILTIILK